VETREVISRMMPEKKVEAVRRVDVHMAVVRVVAEVDQMLVDHKRMDRVVPRMIRTAGTKVLVRLVHKVVRRQEAGADHKEATVDSSQKV
jgi:hypothetical protein